MKLKIYSILIIIFMLFLGCRKEEFTIISPINISFVHADGSQILEGECITPDNDYAILIETSSSGVGFVKVLRVDYTFNGALQTMTFLKDGDQINPVTLVSGINTAQIIESETSTSIVFVNQGDFELIE